MTNLPCILIEWNYQDNDSFHLEFEKNCKKQLKTLCFYSLFDQFCKENDNINLITFEYWLKNVCDDYTCDSIFDSIHDLMPFIPGYTCMNCSIDTRLKWIEYPIQNQMYNGYMIPVICSEYCKHELENKNLIECQNITIDGSISIYTFNPINFDKYIKIKTEKINEYHSRLISFKIRNI